MLSVNGIELPIAVDTIAHGLEEVGDQGRAVSGALLSDRRALKRSWAFRLKLLAAPEALFLRDVVAGVGDVWSFDSHLYSSRGNLAAVTGSGAGVSATRAKYGAQSCRLPSAGTVALTHADIATRGATVFFWAWTGSVWHLECWSFKVGSGAPVVAGARDTAGGATGPNVMSGASISGSTITLIAGAETWVDDVWLLPRSLAGVDITNSFVPWFSTMATVGLPRGPAPRLRVTGIDEGLLHSGTSSALCLGSVEAMPVRGAARGGAWDAKGHELEATLVEV